MRPPLARAKPSSLPTRLESHRRPLTDQERRTLRAKIRSLQARGARARTGWIPIAAVVIIVLWLLTILASDAPWMIITVFWLVIGGLIALWVARDMRKHASQFGDMAAGLQSALVANAADVYDVRARAFVEFEEEEDEGACYGFEIDGPRLVFISGQEFYPGARFPSLDFSLVYIVDEAGRTVDMLFDKRGARAKPARTIPARDRLARPEHLEVRKGGIETLRT
jgi:hypothetical protein